MEYHYRLINPTAARPSYEWHITRCEAYFANATRKDPKIETSQAAAASGRGTQLPLVKGVKPYNV